MRQAAAGAAILYCLYQAFTLKNPANIVEHGFDIVLREENLAQAIDVRKLFAAFLQQNYRTLEAPSFADSTGIA